MDWSASSVLRFEMADFTCGKSKSQQTKVDG